MFHFINSRGSRLLEELGRVVLRSAFVGRRTYHSTSASMYSVGDCRDQSWSLALASAMASAQRIQGRSDEIFQVLYGVQGSMCVTFATR